MLLIDCPVCGQRDEVEFSCAGESHIARPELAADDQTWADFLFTRENAKGVTFERWRHSFGCGRWFNVARCTSTHRIFAVYAMTDAKPKVMP